MTTETQPTLDRKQRREAENAARIELATRRAASGASKVEQRQFPLWFSKLMTAAISRMPNKPSTRSMSTWCKYQWLIHQTVDSWAFDHEGFVKVDGVWCFVTEPYPSSRGVEAVQQFAEMLGVNVEVNLPSWWNPPSTVRHLFTPKELTK